MRLLHYSHKHFTCFKPLVLSWREKDSAAFPVQLELRLIPNDKFSIRLNGSANINSNEPFYSSWIGFSYGMQRTRSDIAD
jgi:hypothetical protein